ncbi:MAG: hypothetical protein J5994_09700 [Ruminococcus sp.]|nr:hypothetical protein [Ruminococcus sp.]
MCSLKKEYNYEQLGHILERIHPGVTIADSQGVFRFVSQSYLNGRTVKKEDILGRFAGSEEMMKIFSPCVTKMVLETHQRVTTVQKGVNDDETFVTGIPVFSEDALEMIISYSSWEITGFDDLRERYNILEYQNKKLLNEIDRINCRSDGKIFIAESSRSKDSRRLAGVFCDAGCPCYIYGPPGSGKSFLASTIYGKKGALYSYDCAPVEEEVTERELLGEGSMISPFSGIYAVIIKNIDRLTPRLQRLLIKKCKASGIIPVGLSEYSLEELRRKGGVTEEFAGEFETYQVKVYSVNERTEDLKSYIDYYLNYANKKYSRNVELTPRAMGCLLSYEWKENIDEVKRTVERLVLTAQKSRIDIFDLTDKLTGASSKVFAQNASLKDMLEFYESGLIVQAYKKYKTSVAVAEKLGISQATAVRKIHKYVGKDRE